MDRNISNIDTSHIRLLTSARIPTQVGEFQLGLYENSLDEKDHLALIHGDIASAENVLVRVHSECYTGDVLGSLRCDCGEQLNTSMRMIAEEGTGIILYLRQEGRGIGLHDKLRAYNLQDKGYDTVDANLALGHGADERDYTIGALILHDLGVKSVRLITNNPEKIERLEAHGISIAERVPLQPHLNEHNTDYLQAKVERMHHMLELNPPPPQPTASQQAVTSLQQRIAEHTASAKRPFATLSYRQHLDGSIVASDAATSHDELSDFMQQVYASHDAFLAEPDWLKSNQQAFESMASIAPQVQRVVYDPALDLDPESAFWSSLDPSLVATCASLTSPWWQSFEQHDVGVIELKKADSTEDHLKNILVQLSIRDVRSVLIGGMPTHTNAILRSKIVDHVSIVMKPSFGSGKVLNMIANNPVRLDDVSYRQIGDDLLLQGKIENN